MLYFRFDENKEDFKGPNHKSVFRGNNAYEYAEQIFEDGVAPEEYQTRYDEGDFDVVDEFIDDELTLDGCSCFTLDEDGVFKSFDYPYFYQSYQNVSVFEGDFIEYGHDGEPVVKCTKIIDQLHPEEFVRKYIEPMNVSFTNDIYEVFEYENW